MKKCFTHIFISFLLAYSLHGQIDTLRFGHVSIEDGLSESSTFCILQDSKGFMWFGTNDGLNKYDGYSFTYYKSDHGNPHSLRGNRVFTLFEDSNGYIWVGTNAGLNRYDRTTDTFTHYVHDSMEKKSLSNNEVRIIYEDNVGRIWVGTNGGGLNIFIPTTQTFVCYSKDLSPPHYITSDKVMDIYEDSSGRVWLGTLDGLLKFNPVDETFQAYQHDPNDISTISHNYVHSIIEGNDGTLWIGTLEGLDHFNPATGSFNRDPLNGNDTYNISQHNIWTICSTKDNQLVIGTLGDGVYFMSPDGTSMQSAKSDLNNPHSLSNDFVWSIYEDNSGILWIGTDLGINKYDPGKVKFHYYYATPNKTSLSNNEVQAIAEDALGKIWVGTKHGLNQIEPYTGSIRQFFHDPSNRFSLPNNFIRALCVDHKGTLWIGTNGGGLVWYDIYTGRFYQYKNDPLDDNSLSNDKVLSIYEDSKNLLWIGTLRGLNRFDTDTKTFTRYEYNPEDNSSLSQNYVHTINADSRGNLWVGTNGGLNRLQKDDTFKRYLTDWNDSSSISNNSIWYIYEDSKQQLWIGTNGGLNRYDYESDSFCHFRVNDEPLKEVVYGILEDNKGALWVSSNHGLIKIFPDLRKIKYFTTGDGLQSNQFSGGACYHSSNGMMWFGGIQGLNSFYPNQIQDNQHIPPVVITDFKISNKSIHPGEKSPLSKTIEATESIELEYDQNFFSFEYAALTFSYPTENEYAYILEGFDDDWIQAGTRNIAVYTNVDPGEYTLRVKGSNNDGVWNEEGTSIEIIIHPPFYRTWWFIILGSLSLIAFVSLILYWRIQNLLGIERLRSRIAADLHDDLGTHLTEISLLSDVLCRTKQAELGSAKDTVKHIGGIARDVIDHLSDIIWLVNPKRDSLYELFIKLKDTYEDFFSYSNKILNITNLEMLKKIRLPMEYRKHLYLIFKEAMNNSLKHGDCHELTINTEVQAKTLIITLIDDGCGFSTEGQYLGNGLNNMAERAKQLHGELQILSKPGKGVVVRFEGKLP